MGSLEVSVIIPVYNAEPYLRQAVESALAQPETREAILVEDASPDGSYEIGRQLAAEHPGRVRLLTHPNRENRGAGETRNLGIRAATCDFICFLDADDYMLPGRFAAAREAIERHPDADGVYEAVGIHFESETARAQWRRERDYDITTVKQAYPPRELFFHLNPIVGGINYIHTNGWTLRRALLDRTGLFNPALRLHQDTELFMRVCILGDLRPGSIERPVAVRRVHESNRITAERPPEQVFRGYQMMWQSIFSWSARRRLHRETAVLAERLVEHRFLWESGVARAGALGRTLRGVLSEARGGRERARLAPSLARLARREIPPRLRIAAGGLKARLRASKAR